MKKEQIKAAFSKVKQEIDSIRYELSEIKELVKSLQDDLITQKLHNLAENNQFLPQNAPFDTSTHNATLRHINTTDSANSTDTSTVPQEVGGLNSPNLGSSIGNQGVSTDRQTLRQTDRQTQNLPKNDQNNLFLPQNTSFQESSNSTSIDANISEAQEILDSLDKIKLQIRLKFKHVTTQEMTVFSSIYQLEEQNPDKVTYNNIALKLGLSQSSIRDYVQRMINKGIPIKKQRVNNKKIILSISSKLRRIASLPTIIKLREL